MNKKLYVGGLPFSVTEDQLRTLFGTHGTVESAKVIMDRYTDRSRGFGFVEMSTQQEAEQAVKALNGIGKPAYIEFFIHVLLLENITIIVIDTNR